MKVISSQNSIFLNLKLATITHSKISYFRASICNVNGKRDRYGFGGHEQDDEVKGSGNHLSFGDYGYDTRLGRRWNIEPLIEKYPSISSYMVFADNPIAVSDPDGREIRLSFKDDAAKKAYITLVNKSLRGMAKFQLLQ